MLIFLISCGSLAVILTGIYFVMSNSALLSGDLVRVSKKISIEKGLDQVVSSEMERLGGDLLENMLVPTLTSYSESSYESAIESAISWGFDSDIVSAATATVSLPSLASNVSFDKSNTLSSETEYIMNPLWRHRGYKKNVSIDIDITPADSGKNFNYSRVYTLYREIPVGAIPFVSAYQFRGTELLYPVKAMSELDAAGEVLGSFYAEGFDFGGGDVTTQPSYLSQSLASVPEYIYPDLKVTWGNHGPLEVASNEVTAADSYSDGNRYFLDPNAIVLSFNGSTLSVASAPDFGTTVPSAITVSTFQGVDRVIVDMETMPVTGSYANRKWYISCTTAEAMAAGIVIDDTGAVASDVFSIATNGHIYFWCPYSDSARQPAVYATSYGALGFATDAYTGGSSMSHASAGFVYSVGAISAYAKKEVLVHDMFNRSGSLASSSPDTVNTESVSWGAVTGTLTCSTSGGGVLSSTISGDNYAAIPIPQTVQENGCITSSMQVDAPMSDELLIWGLSASSTYDTDNQLTFTIDPSASTASISEKWGAVSYATDSGGFTDTYPLEATFSYFPGDARAVILINGTIVADTFISSANAGFVPNYGFLNINPGSSGSLSVTDFKITKQEFGTSLSSLNTSASLLYFVGSIAVGDGIGSLFASGSAINVWSQSSVITAIEGLCERILVHYPHFRKP